LVVLKKIFGLQYIKKTMANFEEELQTRFFPSPARMDYFLSMKGLTHAKTHLEMAVLAVLLTYQGDKNFGLLELRKQLSSVLKRDITLADIKKIRHLVERYRKQIKTGKQKLFLKHKIPVLEKDEEIVEGKVYKVPLYRKTKSGKTVVKRYVYEKKSFAAQGRWNDPSKKEVRLRAQFKPYTDQSKCARTLGVPHLPKGYKLTQKNKKSIPGSPEKGFTNYCLEVESKKEAEKQEAARLAAVAMPPPPAVQRKSLRLAETPAPSKAETPKQAVEVAASPREMRSRSASAAPSPSPSKKAAPAKTLKKQVAVVAPPRLLRSNSTLSKKKKKAK
jgi:hypothetical protein